MLLRNLFILFLLTFFVNGTARAQSEVALLNVREGKTEKRAVKGTKEELRFPFVLDRNLIWLEARVDGRHGTLILDTGAPTLLLNDHGGTSEKSSRGFGSGGAVALAEDEVRSFELGGIEQGPQPAYRIDLSGMEQRSGRKLLGLIGYEQLEDYELLLDYPAREVRLRSSRKIDTVSEPAPRLTLKFSYHDHLPVITLGNGRRKLRFALDTGAGSNLLDPDIGAARMSGRVEMDKNVSLLGLDGKAENCPVIALPQLTLGEVPAGETEFVLTDLDHLQADGEPRLDGILGTAFLRDYRVSIDYRRRRVHFW